MAKQQLGVAPAVPADTATKGYVDSMAGGGAVLPTISEVYGNGFDSAVTISANTTLTRDMKYTTLTVNAGVILNTNGFIVRATTQITNNGTISANGLSATGNLVNDGSSTPSLSGSFGRNGSGANTQLSSSGYALWESATSPDLATLSGGAGANASSTSAEDFYLGAPGFQRSFLRDPVTIYSLRNATFSGGGGGGCSANSQGQRNTGGGGGGVMILAAPSLINNGVICSHGKAGTQVYYNSYVMGGGGGGGVVVTISTSYTGAIPIALGGVCSNPPYYRGNQGDNGSILQLTL